MSKKRSLGSDPLFGESSYATGALDYIGRSPSTSTDESSGNNNSEKIDKKIVSYYIDKDLIREIKILAELTNQCYSSLVSKAIRNYVKRYEF